MLRQERHIDKKYELQLDVYGLETDGKMKMIDWRYEKLALPYELSEMPEAPGAVQVSLQFAEDIAYALGQALKLAYPREGKGNAKAFGNIMASAKRSYWGLLESAFFTYLGAVSQGGFEAAMEAWKKELQRSGWTALEQVLSGLDANADALQRQVQVRRAFGQRLGRILSGKELKNEQSTRTE
jgi:CRISPR system Cascade subunit CasA